MQSSTTPSLALARRSASIVYGDESLSSQKARTRQPAAACAPANPPLWEQLPSLYEAMACGVTVLDAFGTIIYANEAAERILGLTYDQLAGRTALDQRWGAIREDGTDCPGPEHPSMLALRTRQPVRSAILGVNLPNGERRWMQVDAVPLLNPAGPPERVVTSFIDITQHKEAEQRLAAIVALQHKVATTELDLRRVMETIAESITKLTKADGATVGLIEGDDLVYRYATGPDTSFVGLHASPAAGLCGRLIQTGEILRCDDSETDPRVARDLCRRFGVRSFVSVPLFHEQRVVGVLLVWAPAPHRFTDYDEQTLELLAGLLSSAISQALAFEAEQRLVRERTAALEAVRDSEQRFRTLIERAPIGAGILNDQGILETLNDAFADIFGYTRDELVGQHVGIVLPEPDRERLEARLSANVAAPTNDMTEVEAVRKDGRPLTVYSSAVTLVGADGRARRAAFVIDITSQKQVERRFAHMAYHDSLTGLPNRILFQDRVTQGLIAARRYDSVLSVLMLDLDHFKAVNDTLGHDAGDRLLQGIATRIHGVLREEDTAARLGGDEFAVLLVGTGETGAVSVANRIRAALRKPILLDDDAIEASVSIGIASYPAQGDTYTTLLKHADQAMYAARRSRQAIA